MEIELSKVDGRIALTIDHETEYLDLREARDTLQRLADAIGLAEAHHRVQAEILVAEKRARNAVQRQHGLPET